MQKQLLKSTLSIGLGIMAIISFPLFPKGTIVSAVMWSLWGFSILLIVVGVSYSIWEGISNRPKPPKKIGKILPIEQIKHDKRPSTIISIIGVAYFLFIISLGVWYLIQAKHIHFNYSLIFFFALFFIYPIYALTDLVYIRRKYSRMTKSSTVKDADFAIVGDINYVHNVCLSILRSMNGDMPLQRDSLNLLKTTIKGSKIVVEIKHMKDTRVNVYITSDALCIFTKRDNGNNQNNIKNFTDLLYLPVNTFGTK